MMYGCTVRSNLANEGIQWLLLVSAFALVVRVQRLFARLQLLLILV